MRTLLLALALSVASSLPATSLARASEVPSTDLFGFSEGTDIAAPGEISAALFFEGAWGGRPTGFREFGPTLGLTIGVLDNLEISPSLSFAHARAFDEEADAFRSRTGVTSLATAFKLRLLDRETSPFGLAIVAEPSLSFFDPGAAVTGRGWGATFSLLADAELVEDRVFGALNLSYDLGRFRPRGFDEDGERLPWESASELGISGALSFRTVGDLFIGAELGYARAYEGLGLRSFAGEAVFLGPTLYVPLAENVELAAAYSGQVWGRAVGSPGRLDLDSFARHRAKVSLAVSF